MTFKVFKDIWDEGSHTLEQMTMAYTFLHHLDALVNQAATEAVAFQLNSNNPKAFQFYRRAEGFSYGTRTKEYKGAVKIFKASFGSAIEERTYELLSETTVISSDELGDWDDFSYETELQTSLGSDFPHSFKGRGGSKGSRPDIRLALGNGYEALYDITANTDVSRGHFKNKGSNAMSWLGRKNIPFIAEVYYDGA
jgi:hypothetical protein